MENLEGHLDLTAAQPAGEAGAELSVPSAACGIPVPYKLSQRLGTEQRAAIVQYYCEGHSSRETARHFGVGKTAVLEILREAGVRPRPPHQKRIDPIC